MKLVSRSLLLLLALVLVACQGPASDGPGGKDPDPDPSDPLPLVGVINGVLKNSEGEPQPGAQVVLGDGSITSAALEASDGLLAFTNGEGQFAFDVDEAGDYSLTSILKGEGAFARVTVSLDDDGTLTSSPVTMDAAAFGAVAGRIEGSSTNPWAFLLGTSFQANSREGEFVIDNVPAGSYELAPGLLGVRGKSVPVTVVSGEVTEVDEPLVFGPVITGVEPAGFTPSGIDWSADLQASLVTVRGSGFGDTIGVSQLRYGGVQVTDHVVSWADDKIVLRWDWNYPWASKTLEGSDLRFSFADVTGEAVSEPGGLVTGEVVLSDYCEEPISWEHIWVRVTPYVFHHPIRGAEMAITVHNGSAHLDPLGTPVTSVTTDEMGCAEFVVEPNTSVRLPTVMVASFEGVEFEPINTGDWVSVELEPVSGVGAVTVNGQLLHGDSGEPMADDGWYTAGMNYCGSETATEAVPLTLDEQGRFSLEVNYYEDAFCNSLFVNYRGALLSATHLVILEQAEAVTDRNAPVGSVWLDAFTAVTYAVEVSQAVADAGAALYLEASEELDVEVEWQGSTFYSAGSGQFYAMSVERPNSVHADGIGVEVLCGGSCVIVNSAAGVATVTLHNPFSYGVQVDLYAFTEDFQDLNEPANDTRTGAAPVMIGGFESGAIEVVGDVDYFRVLPLDPQSGTVQFTSSGSVATVLYVEDSTGIVIAGPIYDGDSVTVDGGSYLRVEALNGGAGPSASSGYYLEVSF